jgi:hypothetical protein
MGTLAAVDLVLALLVRAQAISSIIAQAQAENRDITQAELDRIVSDDDKARTDLVAAIEKAKSEGR